MDRREPEESSSSQNVNLSIASVQKRGAGKETASVSLSDGSSFFISLPLPDGWAEGRILREDELSFLAGEDLFVRGREWAAGRLALREDSSGRMLQKLDAKGYGGGTGRRIIDDMQRLGFLDDARFSELWIRERLRSHPEGRDALLAGLMKRGVPSACAREVLDEQLSDEDLDEALERCIAKLSGPSGGNKEALLKKLQRRGFSYGAAKAKLFRDNDDFDCI